MKKLTLILLFITAPLFAQSTINNDDSCDIAQLPAATLLLPYFEVAPALGGSETTLFSITNVSANPQIARVTLWTDYGYPVLTFNRFISGYGVMPISLSDVLVRGVIAPDAYVDPVVNPTLGSQPSAANPAINASGCATGPQNVPSSLLSIAQNVFTSGRDPGACGNAVVGLTHTNMIGYATIDVVANCAARSPLDLSYFSRDLLFDNVLTGDYQQYSQGRFTGNSLVHIRAVPEGGTPGSMPTSLPYTFYDRLTKGLPTRAIDRRQPLPSLFAARALQGDGFDSNFRIWREPTTGNDAQCTDYAANGFHRDDVIRFDEHQNATVTGGGPINEPLPPPMLAVTSRVPIRSGLLPPKSLTPDVGGWLYFNLDTFINGTRPNQAWVVTTLIANGYTVSNDAIALGNGCSKAATFQTPIGPAPNVPTP